MYIYIYISCHCLENLEGFGVKRNSEPVVFVTVHMIHRWAQFRCEGKTVFSNTLAYLCP